MIRSAVVLVDTSIIVRLIGIDGDSEAKAAAEEFDRRRSEGQRLVLTVTALIEAGNRVAQQNRPNDRRRWAQQLKKLIEAANQPDPPWILREATLDQQFVDEMIAGDSTGSDLVTLLGDGRLGTGDLAILVERDQLQRKTAHTDVSVWTLDKELSAHG
ncbi:MAG: hypothetical protein OXB90_07220 [Acidimicrobiaceae bacterium]|nr:hypothetical protein [Acidimicrobiaceae bacterium]